MPTYKDWKKQNWDRAHRETDLTALTGTGLGGHLNTLHTQDLITPGASALCVGVGEGAWVRELAERVRTLWALDVSPVAAARMPEGTRFITSPGDLPQDTFDLAMSLWVAPHMSDSDLQEQLNGVVASLKSQGTFAIHYKEPLNGQEQIDNQEGEEGEYLVARSAMMLRTRERFIEMTEQAGGRVEKIVQENVSHFYQITETIAHVKRSEE